MAVKMGYWWAVKKVVPLAHLVYCLVVMLGEMVDCLVVKMDGQSVATKED